MGITCTSCKKELPLIQFFKDASRKGGYKERCKPCTKLYKISWRCKFKPRISRYNKLYKLKKKYPGLSLNNITKIQSHIAAERIKTKYYRRLIAVLKYVLGEKKKYPCERRCCVCKHVKPIEKFCSDNKRPNGRGYKCYRCMHFIRNEKEKEAGGKRFNIGKRKKLHKLFGNKCFKCGDTRYLSIDHHRPLSKGHAMRVGNAVVLCAYCNISKSNKMPEDFYSKKQLRKLESEYGVK